MPTASACRRTTTRPPSGTSSPPSAATAKRCSRWRCSVSQGRAGPRDREASAKWLAAAAKLGHPLAAYDLALLYIEGQLFPQDFKPRRRTARATPRTAGNPEAQYALGTFYKEGRGVPKDMHEAVRLWAQAALADNTDAEVEYAIALFNGDGVAKDERPPPLLFRKAALRGSAIAQDRLARILADRPRRAGRPGRGGRSGT